jgi:Domain of unknown function (DUF6457)
MPLNVLRSSGPRGEKIHISAEQVTSRSETRGGRVTAGEWISSFAAQLDAEAPSQGEIDEILRLAGIAAHSSERIAAPIACWMAGRAGRPLGDVCLIAERLR